jgi:hypothetical protein
MIDFEQASIEEQSHVRNTFLARMTEISESPDAGIRARVHVAALCYCAAQAAAELEGRASAAATLRRLAEQLDADEIGRH